MEMSQTCQRFVSEQGTLFGRHSSQGLSFHKILTFPKFEISFDLAELDQGPCENILLAPKSIFGICALAFFKSGFMDDLIRQHPFQT